MTELTFLVDLLLNHKLPKVTRDAVAARIKEVEAGLGAIGAVAYGRIPADAAISPGRIGTVAIPPHLVGQPASTIAAMMRHEQAGAAPAVPIAQPDAEVVPAAPVVAVAQTGATAAAMAKRQQAIAAQISGKPIGEETSPRKW